MKFSHISDTHLGLVQYGLEEREQDIYNSFNQAIDISINDKVDFVIFAGDVFHTPTPSGTAILQMANALKRLKQNGIESFFVLGEHDISRIRTTPIPYVYHNLEFSKYIGREEPVYYKNVMIIGLDKIRKNEMEGLEEKFSKLESSILLLLLSTFKTRFLLSVAFTGFLLGLYKECPFSIPTNIAT